MSCLIKPMFLSISIYSILLTCLWMHLYILCFAFTFTQTNLYAICISYVSTLLQIIFFPFIIHPNKKYHTFHSPLLIHPFIHKIVRSKFQSNSSPIFHLNIQLKKAICPYTRWRQKTGPCQGRPLFQSHPSQQYTAFTGVDDDLIMRCDLDLRFGADHKKYIEKLYTLLLSNFKYKILIHKKEKVEPVIFSFWRSIGFRQKWKSFQ